MKTNKRHRKNRKKTKTKKEKQKKEKNKKKKQKAKHGPLGRLRGPFFSIIKPDKTKI
jgi:hypothetical protein